ncbi:MAG TPA: hypothetical protein VLA05_08405 [Coriobacteriia bacterium]|nr:hypothetical protein [Coriobacteriia bacterium]
MADDRVLTFSPDGDKSELAGLARTEPAVLTGIVAALAGDDRRSRQFAASTVHELALHEPALLKPYSEELADALHRPESQTRWEVLGTFEKLVAVDARLVDKALDGAESALHDEESGVVRLAAFRLMTSYGATTARRSERVWPLISEAIRCYHGDAEFPAMLSGVYRMVSGNAADEVKLAAADIMAFDAENGKGLLKRRASRIVECAPKKGRKKKPQPEA